MVLKKWITLTLCLFTTILSANTSNEVVSILGNPKGLELNIKVMRFFATHPKTADYLYNATEALVAVLEKYTQETEQLIKQYPSDPASSLAEKRVANIEYFLKNRETLTKVGFFLFLGVYDLNAYQDPKTGKELIKTQDAIYSHYIKRAQAQADYESYRIAKNAGEDPLEKIERELMITIKNLCQKSKDPFFVSTLYPLIQGCQTREEVLKLFAPFRDETVIDEESGELFSEAEEAYQMLNEKMWNKFILEVKKYFNRKETVERFIEITADAFEIPPMPAQFSDNEGAL
ncbi:MAG: hypothetical protein AB7N99_01915 [Simkaniaceae bacterium]